MQWMFKIKPDLISEYEITSFDGKQISFKYSRLQRSIRMKCGDHHGVFLLDKHLFASRKVSFRNVYGSEIGLMQKSLLHEHSGSLLMHETNLKFQYKLHPREQYLSIQIADGTISCRFATSINKENDEVYILALLALTWMHSTTTTTEVKTLVEAKALYK